MIRFVEELEVQNTLGEGVVWDAFRQKLWWTDIDQQKLYRYDTAERKLDFWHTPERLSCLSPVITDGEIQDYLVVAFESGFAYYQPASGCVQWIKKIEPFNQGTRLNDGRTDRQGRFWAGSMVEDAALANAKGKLYCLDRELQVTPTLDELTITNSLCWSPTSEFLYHCDTPTQKIHRYTYDSDSGSLGASSVFASTDNNCFPDGSTVDSEGYLWNAQWGGSKVVRYSPRGEVDLTIELPVSQPTCVAFGGENLDLLFVTSAHQGFSETQQSDQPRAGNLFIYKTEFTGIEETPFSTTPAYGMSSVSSGSE